MKFNKEQSEAIVDRGNDLLLSASAGTGKTAVLIERVCKLIIEDKAQIDEFLIVTFTEAAALELKSRVSDRLNKAIAEEGCDIRHLARAMTMLPSSNISTIHGFCKQLIEENFIYLDIEPDFKVADNSDMLLLKDESFKKVLEESKENQDILPSIQAFSKVQSDDNLQDIVMSIYADAAASKSIEDFYQNLYENTDKDHDVLADIKESAAVECKKISSLFGSYFSFAEASNFDKYVDCAHKDTESILILEDLLTTSAPFTMEDYQKAHLLFKDFHFITMPSARGKAKDAMDLDSAEAFKALRSEIKDKTGHLVKKYFKFSAKQLELDIQNSKEISLALIRLAQAFSKKYQEMKKKHNVIDFDDMQHFAMKILEKQEIAESYQKIFRYIFVDEFQDTSDIQDALIERIRSRGSLFIVGDYKQSIYAFRKARPELFLNKYDEFSLSNQAKTIELNQNFRSLPRVLDSVNDVFEHLMRKNYGGIDYKKMAMLQSGKQIVEEENKGEKTLITFIDKDRINAIAKEDDALSADEIYYRVIIDRIKEITEESYPVFDEAGNLLEHKKYNYGDICILSRSPNKKASWIKKIFEENGIALSIDIEENLFELPEILVLIDFLKLVSNPKDDMALLSVMRSPIGLLTDDDLFELSECPHDFYADFLNLGFMEQAKNKDGDCIEDELKEKLKKLSDRIEKFRKNDYLSIRHRLDDLMKETNYTYHILGKRGAFSAYHALEDFFLYIEQFEQSGKNGIFQLLEHFDEMKKRGGVLVYQSKMQNESESVKLLSIHKSKGLQFKYVIIQDSQKAFNRANTDSIVLSDDKGLISKNVYRDRGIMHANPFFYIEKYKKLGREVFEEMRLLYVAMTRAEYRLEIIAKTKLSSYSLKNFEAGIEKIPEASSYLDWILHATEFKGILHDDYDSVKGKEYAINKNYDYKIADIEKVLEPDKTLESRSENVDLAKIVDDFRAVNYPSQKGVSRKTVSQLKATENKKAILDFKVSENGGGAERGNAYHKFMHFFVKSRLSMAAFLEINKEHKYLSDAELKMVDKKDIERFCQTDLYARIQGAKTLWLEKPFVYKKEIDEEWYHLQGIIDLAFIENGKIVIVDYKTDKVKDEKTLVERYHTQLELYAEAISAITNCEIKECLIYSFEMGKSISLC